MAANTKMQLSLLFILIISSFFTDLCHPPVADARRHSRRQLEFLRSQPLATCGFDKIYQFGDSISDTGNLIRESPVAAASPYARLPYGETAFKRATGRCSDGLLMIDFIALASGLPLLNPYMDRNANFSNGVNFAVAGSTAQPAEFLAARGVSCPVTRSSLNVQLQWMTAHFNSIAQTTQERLKNSLFMVGEIGGNDYNYALFQRKSMEEVRTMVPNVVQAISDAVRKVINYGAVRVIVPGNFPLGCFPVYLTLFQTNNLEAYDEHRCLRDLNNFSVYHNGQLKQSIEDLNIQYPNVTIVYGDFYNAFLWLLQNATQFGFVEEDKHEACCGAGGSYNFEFTNMCGSAGVPVCSHPSSSISWDGIHLTQTAYRIMAGWLVQDILPKLNCNA